VTEIEYKPGDRVIIIDGVYAGCRGTVDGCINGKLVTIQLDGDIRSLWYVACVAHLPVLDQIVEEL
jgi:hypothetical protein